MKLAYVPGYLFLLLLMAASPAYAAVNFSTITNNIADSLSTLPGVITALSYLMGLIFGVMGVLKLRQHVEDPRSTPLKEAVIRFLAGGALFALPIAYEAMYVTIAGDNSADMDTEMGLIVSASGIIATIVTIIPTEDLNLIFMNIADSFDEVPGLIAGGSYLFGLVLGVVAIIKLKDHVSNPEQTPLKDGVVRLLLAGALFSLPTIFVAAYHTINGDGFNLMDYLYSGLIMAGFALSSEDPINSCLLLVPRAPFSVGSSICQLIAHTAAFPTLLTGFAYLLGLVLMVWGVTKLKEHVLNPNNVSVWEGLSRLLAAGALFALPTVVGAVYVSVASVLIPHINGGFNPAAGGNGLDSMMVAFIGNILGPAQNLMNWFGYIAGVIFIIIGITRLMKTAQEGVRGPGGVGTIMTFLAGGALIAFSPMMTAFTASLFTIPYTATFATLNYDIGFDADELAHVHAVIGGIIRFMIILGLVSFMRGIFIVRGVAEGDNQASMMAGVTHLIGGALAVNLGPFLNAVQSTLGLEAYGVNFG